MSITASPAAVAAVESATSLAYGLALAEVTLVMGPPLALAAYFILNSWSPQAFRRTLAGALCLLVAIFIAWKWKLGLKSPLANLASGALAYVLFCFVAACCLRNNRIYIRIPTLALAAPPIALGYLLATIGVLGLGWIVADLVAAPIQTETMAPNLDCELTPWGSAASTSGYSVRLYRTWPSVPLLRRQVANIVVDQRSTMTDATCADALAAYRP